tara:strand:+ start:515 stop:2455 length:1941 start_codon:yes stop_codon:yes gene_type:complete
MAQNLVLNILARDKTKQAFNGIRAGLSNLRSSVFSVQSALVGIGAGLVVRSFIKVGAEVESLGIRFNFLFGNVKEGTKAFDNLVDFASKVPFSLEEISSASGNLAVVSKDADDLSRILKITGNVAAVTGLDFQTTATQIQRSFAGGIASADIFRERGVRALLGFKAGATVSVEQTIQAFEDAFGENGRFSKATEVLSTTFTGTLSMLGDKLFKFKRDTNEAGFFDFVKQALVDVNKLIEDNEQVLKKLALQTSDFMVNVTKNVLIGGAILMDTLKPVFQMVGVAINGIIQTVKALPSGIRELGIIGFLMLGGRGKLLVVTIMATVDIIRGALGSVLETYAEIMDKVNTGLRKLKLISKETFEDNLLTFDQMFDTAQKLKTPLKEINEQSSATKENFGKAEKSIRKFLEQLEKNAIISRKQFNEMMNALDSADKSAKEFGLSLAKIKDNILQQFKKDFESINSTLSKMATSGIKAFSRGLAEALVLGKDLNMTFRDLAQKLLVDIVAFTIQIVIQETIRNALTKQEVSNQNKITSEKKKQLKMQMAMMAMSGNPMALFGFAGFDKGGAVSKGKPIVVGERGAELFIPNSSGQITQSARGTGGGATTVNFNINTVDASGFDELLQRSRGTITQLINNAVNENGSKNLI